MDFEAMLNQPFRWPATSCSRSPHWDGNSHVAGCDAYLDALQSAGP
jgi:hypothetical protein